MSQAGRKLGGPGVEGLVRRFTSMRTFCTLPCATRMVCSTSGRSATRASMPVSVTRTRSCSTSTRSTRSPAATVPLTPLMVSRTEPTWWGICRTTNCKPLSVNKAAHSSTAGAATAVTVIRTARASSSRRMGWRPGSELRREIDVQTRPTVGRERLRDIDPESHHRQPHPQADPDRILEERRAEGRSRLRPRDAIGLVEAVERIAIVEEGSDTKAAGQLADEFHRAGEHVLAAGLEIGAGLRLTAAVGRGQHLPRGVRLAHRPFERRELVVGEAAYAVVAAGEEAVHGGHVVEVLDEGGADLIAQQQVPLAAQVEDPLGLQVQLHEVGLRAERAVRGSYGGEERTLEQWFAEISLRHASEVELRHQQLVGARGIDVGDRWRLVVTDGVHAIQLPHVLPTGEDIGEAHARRLRSRGHIRQRFLLDDGVQRDVLDRGVAEGNAVMTLHVVALHLRGLYRDAQVVAERVDA